MGRGGFWYVFLLVAHIFTPKLEFSPILVMIFPKNWVGSTPKTIEGYLDIQVFMVSIMQMVAKIQLRLLNTLPPIIIVQWKMHVSPIGSLPFKHSHVPLPLWVAKSVPIIRKPLTLAFQIPFGDGPFLKPWKFFFFNSHLQISKVGFWKTRIFTYLVP